MQQKMVDIIGFFATVYPFESCDGSKGYLSCEENLLK